MVSYLVLDFNRPNETRLCLESIRSLSHFEHKVVFLSNGGVQDYVWELYAKERLIDFVLFWNENRGLGHGTLDLFKACPSEWAIYFQNDQILARPFEKSELEAMIRTLSRANNIGSIALAGDHCQGQYSERAHLINRDFYNAIPDKPCGGAGPYHNLPWIEGYIQNYYAAQGLKHLIWAPLVRDNGKYAVRQNPDGSLWKHSTDEKKLWLLKGPVKERFVYPKFSKEEWEDVLTTQKWEPGTIPQEERAASFKFWE